MELTAINISKTIRKRIILSDINLHLISGNIYGFVGPNGSGKTMLFRALSGLMSIDSGSIIWNNKVLHQDFSVLPSSGIVLENAGLYPNMTGIQNLTYLAKLTHRIGTAEIKRALLRVGLDPDDKRPYSKYSLGMKQRLAIAQAVMEEPDVIMLDEPTNALDEDGVEKIRKLIIEEKQRGALILLASHNKEDIHILVDQLYRINKGRLYMQEELMKLHFLHMIALCLILAAAILGCIKRQSYTNFCKDKNYLDQLQVAVIPEDLCIYSCDELKQSLPKSDIILRVYVTGDIEQLFGVSRQKVRIEQIYTGSELNVGQEIYLFSNNWNVVLDGKPNSLERGFVNIMKVGKEYLVFVSHKIDSLNESIPVYEISNITYITPVFCYENQSNLVVEPEGETTYVPYMQVKDNEFFAESEVALEAWNNLKSDMLALFPVSG